MRKRRRQTTTQSLRAAESRATARGEQGAQETLLGVAVLRIALEARRDAAAPLDDVVAHVLARMRIPQADFTRYLNGDGRVLHALLQSRARAP